MDADFVARARAAGYTDAEIEQALAMSGRSPKDVRAMIGQQPLDVVGSLASGIRQLMGTAEPGPPQAMTRVTHTPVRWGEPGGGAYGIYNPGSGAITMDAGRLPQANPDDGYMSNILRHESVHALMDGSDVRQRIQAYFDGNQQLAATGRENLSRVDPQAGQSNTGLATEAPAYAVQGYRFGMPDETVQQYQTRMPPYIRQRYDKLLRK